MYMNILGSFIKLSILISYHEFPIKPLSRDISKGHIKRSIICLP